VSSSLDGCVEIAYGALRLVVCGDKPIGNVRMLFADNSLVMLSFSSARFSGESVSDLATSGMILVKRARRFR